MANNKISVKTSEYPEHGITVYIFNHPKFGEIRALTIHNKPWFVVEDITAVFDMFPVVLLRCARSETLQVFKNDKITALNMEKDGIHIIAGCGLGGFMEFCKKEYPEKGKEFERWMHYGMFPVLRDSALFGTEEESENEEDAEVDETDEERAIVICAFYNPDFGKIRVLILKGKPCFVLEDIEESLKALEVPSKRLKAFISDIVDVDKIQTDEEELCLLDEQETDSLLASCLKGATPAVKKFICWIEGGVLPALMNMAAAVTE